MHITWLTGVTLNKNLFETALRHLLVESAEYSVQMFEGSGTQWRKTRQVSIIAVHACILTVALGILIAFQLALALQHLQNLLGDVLHEAGC